MPFALSLLVAQYILEYICDDVCIGVRLRTSPSCFHWVLSLWENDPVNNKQGKPERFESCDRPSNIIQIGFKSPIFQPVWLEHFFMDDLKKQ